MKMKDIKTFSDLCYELDKVVDRINKINTELRNQMPKDYCGIGMDRCVCCGWQGDYPVSGCPCCHKSFVE